jgi:hypothetical protein
MDNASVHITSAQRELLARIASGAAPLTKADSGLAVSVYALRSKGLVSTRTLYGYREAEITDRGRAVLAGDAHATPEHRPRRRTTDPLETSIRVAMLVDAVLAADGHLTIAEPTPAVRREWRRAIHAAHGSAQIPAGMRLRHQGRDRGDLILWFEAIDAAPRDEPAVTVPVPMSLQRPHPLIAAARSVKRDRDGWVDTRRQAGTLHLRVSADSVGRALRLVQGLVDEALRRGYNVDQIDSYGCAGGLGVYIGGHGLEVAVSEETKRVPHEPSKSELADAARYSWHRIPEWDHVPSGRLVLKSGHSSYATTLATDRQRWRIEDRLGNAMAELESLAAIAEERRREAVERETARQRTWEVAMVRARDRFDEHQRVDWLGAQLRAVRHARDIREFVTAAGGDASLADDVTEWLSWAADYADRIDPLRSGITPPSLREPSRDDLRPFLDGLSPYGPTAR